jgi:uncharacterized protein DUF2786
MSETDPKILTKVKYLQRLAASPNENEALAAKTLAQKLIDKHGISEQELSESIRSELPLYDDSDILFRTPTIVGWKSLLSLLLSQKYDSYVVQEHQVPSEGPSEYVYFLYGDDEDAPLVKHLFNAFLAKIEELVATNCVGRGERYLSSYQEGAVNGIREVLDYLEFSLPKMVKVKPEIKAEDKTKMVKTDTEEKIAPPEIESTADVGAQSKVEDPIAYLRGVADGSQIELDDDSIDVKFVEGKGGAFLLDVWEDEEN